MSTKKKKTGGKTAPTRKTSASRKKRRASQAPKTSMREGQPMAKKKKNSGGSRRKSSSRKGNPTPPASNRGGRVGRAARRAAAVVSGKLTLANTVPVGVGVLSGVLTGTQLAPLVRSRFKIGGGMAGDVAVKTALAIIPAAGIYYAGKKFNSPIAQRFAVGHAIGGVVEIAAGGIRYFIARRRAAANTTPNAAAPAPVAARQIPAAGSGGGTSTRTGVASLFEDGYGVNGLNQATYVNGTHAAA